MFSVVYITQNISTCILKNLVIYFITVNTFSDINGGSDDNVINTV